jgi:hypothetical protein
MTDIKVTWEAPKARKDGAAVAPADFAAVIIMSQDADGNWTDLQHLAGDALSALIQNVPPGAYTYGVAYVDSFNQRGDTGVSNAVEVASPLPALLAAPTNVVATAG